MNKIIQLFNIKYPIIQGGMIWHSGYKLASAVSNSGGLGLIGAGSMYPDVLREHIIKCKKATDQPFGVNVPMFTRILKKLFKLLLKKKFLSFLLLLEILKLIPKLKKEGRKVVHVVSSVKFAVKCQEAGVDAVVAEGFEAGGHNGREETTTLSLIPDVRRNIEIPLIAAGGIAVGSQMKAAMILGADGVQIGSRFAATLEASAHDNWKQKIVEAKEGDTQLTLKRISTCKIGENKFFYELEDIYKQGKDRRRFIEN
jgi:enoyl-[acyl-carrier protein] reductase II